MCLFAFAGWCNLPVRVLNIYPPEGILITVRIIAFAAHGHVSDSFTKRLKSSLSIGSRQQLCDAQVIQFAGGGVAPILSSKIC